MRSLINNGVMFRVKLRLRKYSLQRERLADTAFLRQIRLSYYKHPTLQLQLRLFLIGLISQPGVQIRLPYSAPMCRVGIQYRLWSKLKKSKYAVTAFLLSTAEYNTSAHSPIQSYLNEAQSTGKYRFASTQNSLVSMSMNPK